MHPTIGNELAQAAMADLCQQAHLLWVIVNGFSLEETRTGDPERPGPARAGVTGVKRSPD